MRASYFRVLFLLFFSTYCLGQELDKYNLLLEEDFIPALVASSKGDFLIAAHSRTKTIRLYNAVTLELMKSFSIPKEIPMTFGNVSYSSMGEPFELSLYSDRYLSVTCFGGYIVHIDLTTEKVSWYKTGGSGNPENMFMWTGGYIRANQIFIQSEEQKQIWYVNPLTNIVSGPFDFPDAPTQMNDGVYFTVKFNVPKFIDINIKDFRTKALISKITLNNLKANDKYNFSALLSPDNKYLLVNLYTGISIYNIQNKERIFYRTRESSYPPNIFITNDLVGFGGTGDDQLSFYNVAANEFLGKLRLTNYSSTIASNKTHLFIYRNMKLNDGQFVSMLGSIRLNELLNSSSEYSVNVFEKFDGKTLEELKSLIQN